MILDCFCRVLITYLTSMYSSKHQKLKIRAVYQGIKTSSVEDKIKALAEKNGGVKAGDWSYEERAFSCLFVFKKEQHLLNFKNEVGRELGYNHKINFFAYS